MPMIIPEYTKLKEWPEIDEWIRSQLCPYGNPRRFPLEQPPLLEKADSITTDGVQDGAKTCP